MSLAVVALSVLGVRNMLFTAAGICFLNRDFFKSWQKSA